MSSNSFFVKRIVEFIKISILLIIIFASFFVDIIFLKNNLTEISVTEISQEVVLSIIAGLFIGLSFRYSEIKYGMLMIAGLFLCMLIRELDFITDKIALSWFHFVLAIILICLYLAIKHKENTLSGLNHFCKSEACQIMICGLLLILVTSRIIGMKILWQHLLGPSYRVAKNAAEEGNELLGYLFCLISTLKYSKLLWQQRKIK
jgi:hypothetical protein